MKRSLIVLLLLVCSPVIASGQRMQVMLEEGWRFKQGHQAGAYRVDFDDTPWSEVSVPHTWNTDLIKNQVNGDYSLGIGWYRRSLPMTPAMQGKRIFLRFRGALAAADVYVNGQHVGRHEGGYTAFCFEITSVINLKGVNSLAVKVDNSHHPDIVPDGSRLFTRFGGIYRPVTLLVTEPTCITPLDNASSGVYILQENVTHERADLKVTTKLSNGLATQAGLTVKTTILDADGQVVLEKTKTTTVAGNHTQAVSQSFTVDTPHLWHGRRDPYLYTVHAEVEHQGRTVDHVQQRVGLSFYHVDVDDGFFLNGQPYRLYGVCRHQEWEHEGSALTDEHHRRDVNDILDIGATTLRLAHYPQAETMYDLCDESGLIVWAEIPVVQGVNTTRPGCFANAQQQLIEMIRQNYNHPSICFWGLYNESWMPADQVKILHDMAKSEDPSRLTVAATNKNLGEKHHVTDLIGWNKYPMWYGNYSFGQLTDGWHRSAPHLKIGVSEYGAGGCIDQHQIPPQRPNPTTGRFYPEEYMNLVHETVWPDLEKRSYLWGIYLWNMFDFSWPGVTRGSRINLNNKGLITYDRQTKKDTFYYYKANWTDDPVLYITSRRFVNRTEPHTPVKVYSNCQNLQLSLNGQTYPAPVGEYGVYIWPSLPLQPGDNEVKVTAIKGHETIVDTCTWTYTPDGPGTGGEEPQDNSVYIAAARASSVQTSKNHLVEHAYDRDTETFWCAQNGNLPQWIEFDLLQATDISGVRILWGRDAAYTYTVQISDDGKSWQTVARNTDHGQLKEHAFQATTRLVRIHCTGTPANAWAVIREVTVLAP